MDIKYKYKYNESIFTKTIHACDYDIFPRWIDRIKKVILILVLSKLVSFIFQGHFSYLFWALHNLSEKNVTEKISH